ncbi:MAG TPA: DUF433 domain-containing protein [Nitriliruptorales bacterium]|nr:DUF433 domain-containing protein [Nitriliruptorales bacterium]
MSTVYDWAPKGGVVRSVSQVRRKLWSYADLMAARIVYWLRHPKYDDAGAVAASPTNEIRRALRRLEEAGLDVWVPAADEQSGSPLLVDRTGRVSTCVCSTPSRTPPDSCSWAGTVWICSACSRIGDGRGPDLARPRPRLRIVPGKLSGEPHVAQTRIATASIAALHRRGYPDEPIGELYPDVDRAAVV